MMADVRKDEKEVACQQILLRDSSVYSIQWLVIPDRYAEGLTAIYLLDRYLTHIREYTRALIRPVKVEGGIEFRLFTTALSILSFSPPEFHFSAGSFAAELCISGGILVQAGECDRGRFSLIAEQVADGTRITLQLSDYCPLLLGSSKPSPLRKLLYRLTQAYIHKIATVKYLALLYRDLTGRDIHVRLKKVTVREGEET